MEQTQKSKPSIALWVPCLWFLISSIRGSVYPVQEDPSYVEGHPYPIILITLIILGGIILYSRRLNLSAFVKENKLIILLYCLMGLSIFWSSFPWISFKRWIKTIGSLEMVLIIMTEPDPLATFSYVLRRFFYLVVPLSLILIFFFPSLGQRTYPEGNVDWVGLFIDRNNLAVPAMIFSLYFVWKLTKKKQEKNKHLDGFLLLLSLITLVGSGSATSFLGFIFGLGIVLLIMFEKKNVKHLGVTIAYLLGLGVVFWFLFEATLLRESIAPRVLNALGRDMTFTGRVELWSELWKIGLMRPFLGQGFGGFWVPENSLTNSLWGKLGWSPIDAHNGYLDVFIEMGILGVAAVLLVVIKTYQRISGSFLPYFESARLRMIFLFVFILHNFAETSLCNLNNPLWVCFLFSAAFLPTQTMKHVDTFGFKGKKP